ncbi:unnamed protein product [Phaedon cochleariae]|uniref:HTH psq-type domain-containing protein n=1 Tax=Phaedon cochleariae TaxID=80249 RepID=A0A9N9X271_PHACE|nr:unnamed protein product [Phaedon cochleariae]
MALLAQHRYFLVGRPKGQHSAPRGGPPRSWTNAELTEALQHVWNKKMTTSQASRIFGIPYNSLLMYVRGKYGKSLKLEQLRKDCIGVGGATTPTMDLLGVANNNNKSERDQEQSLPNTRPPSAEGQPSVFNPFSHSFYPDFGAGFPLPVSMIHLLPQNEKHLEQFGQQQVMEDECKGSKDLDHMDHDHEMFRAGMGIEDKREMVQQSGQN